VFDILFFEGHDAIIQEIGECHQEERALHRILGFDGVHMADEVLNKLRFMHKEYLVDLEDACVVELGKDGKVQIKLAVNLTAIGAATGGSRGALWGNSWAFFFSIRSPEWQSARLPAQVPGRCQDRLLTMASAMISSKNSARQFPWALSHR
jgi:hypothetical protein